MTQTHTTKKDIKDIQTVFMDMCQQIYKNTQPKHEYCRKLIRSRAHSTTILFLKHIKTAETLTSYLQTIADDIQNNIQTPATLLIQAHYSIHYTSLMIRMQIHRHMRLAQDILSTISEEDLVSSVPNTLHI